MLHSDRPQTASEHEENPRQDDEKAAASAPRPRPVLATCTKNRPPEKASARTHHAFPLTNMIIFFYIL